MRRRRARGALVGGGTALAALLAVGLTGIGGGESERVEAPAPPAALQRIAARNERASAEAAAEVRANAHENLKVSDAEFSRQSNVVD